MDASTFRHRYELEQMIEDYLKICICGLLTLAFFSSCQPKSESTTKSPVAQGPKKKIKKQETNSSPKPIKRTRSSPPKKVQKVKEVEAKSRELAELVIDNKTDYASSFVQKLRSADGMEKVEFQNGVMILNEADSIAFPDIPSLHKTLNFTSQKDDLKAILSVNRFNYTSIEIYFRSKILISQVCPAILQI